MFIQNYKFEFLKTVFLAVIFCLSSSVGHSQILVHNNSDNQRNLKIEQGIQLQEALKIMEQEYNVVFLYRTDTIGDEEVKDSYVLPGNVEDALDLLLEEKALAFKAINPKTYGIFTKKDVSQATKPAILQTTVVGTVTDAETGEPLPGANVAIQGTTTGSSTDMEGEYSISGVEPGTYTFVASFIGYQQSTQEVTIAEDQTEVTLNFSLQQQAVSGEELVVVGYGTQERASVTGAVSTVDTEDFQERATPSISQALQGQAAGVQVSSAGHPGAEPNIQIRGVSTLGNNDPLYIIDGVPVENISDFNINDVETIQVLKDASSAAIYGSRAANGVVIITTTQGQPGGINVDYNMYAGRQDIPEYRWWNMADREQYQFLNNLARENVGLPLQAGNDPNHPNFVDDIDTDWQEAAFRPGMMQDHNLTISGGSERSTYSISGNITEQEGTMRGPAPYYDRKSVRVNSSHEVGSLRFGENIFYSNSHQKHQASDHADSSVENIIKMAPTIPVFDEDRVGGYGGASTDVQNAFLLNPIGYNNLVTDETDRNRILVNLWGEYDVLDNLTYKLNFSYDHTASEGLNFIPVYDMGFAFNNQVAEMNDSNFESSRFLIENTLNYQNDFGDHSIDVLAGYSEERNKSDFMSGFSRGFSQPYFQVLSAGPDDRDVSGSRSLNNLRSFFGRFNYDYDDRYLLSATVRHDGSSRFSDEFRYGTFPSVSVGWRINNESFFDVDFISELKLRASYGEVGNQDIGDFPYTPFISTGEHYNFDGEAALGWIQTDLVNPDAKWETNVSSGVGVDVSFLDESVTFSAEYYTNESQDLLLDVPIPDHVGADDEPTLNAGTIRNTGFEFSLQYRRIAGDLQYSVGTNLSTINNEVVSLGTRDQPINGSGSRTEEGREVGEFYGYVTDGLFQNQQEVDDHAFQTPSTSPGDIRFKDLDDSGEVTAEDRTYLGSAFPDFYFGINADVSYRGWDLSMQFSGSYGNQIYNRARNRTERAHEFDNYPAYFMEDVWMEDDKSGHLPRMAFGDPNGNARMSDRWIEDGSYIKLRNIQLGYTIPSELTERVGVSSFRVYASAQNILTITGYSGYDPEVGPGGDNNPNNSTMNRGVDAGSWPNPRVFRLGVQLGINTAN